MFRNIIFAAALVAATAAHAEEEKFGVHRPICPPGQVPTYKLQCDQGSRSPVERVWNPAGVGAEICRASRLRCEPLVGWIHLRPGDPQPEIRPGFEVQDFGYGELVFVGWGIDRLLGLVP